MELSTAQLSAIREATATAVTAALLALPSSISSSAVAESDSQQQGTSTCGYISPELSRLPSCVAHVSGDIIRQIKEAEFVDLASLS